MAEHGVKEAIKRPNYNLPVNWDPGHSTEFKTRLKNVNRQLSRTFLPTEGADQENEET